MDKVSKLPTAAEILDIVDHCISSKGCCDNCTIRPMFAESRSCSKVFARYIYNGVSDFDWGGFKIGEFAVKLQTEKEYKAFMQECEKRGMRWTTSKSATAYNCWHEYREHTCVMYNEHDNSMLSCGDDLHYIKFCSIVPYSPAKKIEPAPAATGTDSKVPSNNNVANATNTNDITHKLICQAFESVNVSGNTTLRIYESMTEDEQRAFDMGEAFAYLAMARDKLKPLKDGESDD